jgi:hypothetical protein
MLVHQYEVNLKATNLTFPRRSTHEVLKLYIKPLFLGCHSDAAHSPDLDVLLNVNSC